MAYVLNVKQASLAPRELPKAADALYKMMNTDAAVDFFYGQKKEHHTLGTLDSMNPSLSVHYEPKKRRAVITSSGWALGIPQKIKQSLDDACNSISSNGNKIQATRLSLGYSLVIENLSEDALSNWLDGYNTKQVAERDAMERQRGTVNPSTFL